MEFYSNKKNNVLKFKINSDGVDVNKIESRLIFESKKNNNYIFYGKVKDNVCEFEVPELTLYEKGDYGKVKFEIISDDLYFPVWKDEFEIKTQVNITLEKMVDDVIKQDNKPKITMEYIKEDVIDDKFTQQKNSFRDVVTELIKEEKVQEADEQIFEPGPPPPPPEDIEVEIKDPVQIKQIMKFGSFKK